MKVMDLGNSRLWMFAGAIALVFGAMPLQAGLILTAGSVTALAGSTDNTIDVNLTNTGPTSLTIGGFSLEVSVNGAAVTFPSVSSATILPYIFTGHSSFGSDIATSVGGQTAIASDLFDVPLAGATVGAGTTVGLADIAFNVAPNTPAGTFTVTIGAFPDTSVSDAQGNDIPLQSLTAGSITIPGAVNTPEPSALFETGTAFLVGALALLWKSRQGGVKAAV